MKDCAVVIEEASAVPFRLASNGFMSKTSTPCILPRISNRSRPVDWSRSVGTVPGSAPGGRRSSSDLISVEERERESAFCVIGEMEGGRGRCLCKTGSVEGESLREMLSNLRKEPSSYPVRLALDRHLLLLLLIAIHN